MVNPAPTSSLHFFPKDRYTYRQCQQRYILVSRVDEMNDFKCGFSGSIDRKKLRSPYPGSKTQIQAKTHALPFLEFIKSATSMFRARLGS